MGPIPFVLLLCIAVSRAALPNGYILEVEPVCGYVDTDGAKITVTTDLQVNIRATCNGSNQAFITNDGVHYQLSLGYPDLGSHACSFKRTGPNVYEVGLIVSFGEIWGLPPQPDQEMTVTCKFDRRRKHIAGEGSVLPLGVLPLPVEDESDTDLSLRILDSFGRDASGKQLALGTRAVLQASVTGQSEGQGIRPVSCDAVGSAGERYAVIRQGCGDGIIFDKNVGFVTTGGISTSPYFSIFRFPHTSTVKFDCSFTLCTADCDGSSCLQGEPRDRRSGRQLGKLVRVHTNTLSVHTALPANNSFATVVVVKKPEQELSNSPYSILYNPYFLIPVVVLGALAVASCFVAICACARRNSAQLYEVEKEWTLMDRYDMPYNSKSKEESKMRSCINNHYIGRDNDKNDVCICTARFHVCDPNCSSPCNDRVCQCSENSNPKLGANLYSNPWDPRLDVDCLKPSKGEESKCDGGSGNCNK